MGNRESLRFIWIILKNIMTERFHGIILQAEEIIRDHKEGHARLAETLLTKEVMYSEDLKEIFGERQWRSRTEEIMLLQAERDAAREAAKAAESKPDVEEEKENSSEPQDVVAVEVNPVEETKPQDDNDDSSVATPPPFKGV